jgi:hypothetical protein
MPVDCTPDNLAELAACFKGLNPKQASAAQIFLLCAIVNGGSDCGTPTTTIQVVSAGANWEGNYEQLSPTEWEQVTPVADYGIRLVAGVWEVYELIFPGPVVFSTPEAVFPCGTWTSFFPPGIPFSASYV